MQMSVHCRDVVLFWSTVGQAQFPSLASLARRILSVPALAPKTIFDERHASVQPEQLHTFLMLRSMFDTEREE
uniref:Dimer_Tnp_hAT domain-containing protein n=1 Tax=Angiostrongylus cantonensis TaxID=6313 RepID=A0A0K0D4J9_ANGCA